MLSAIIEVRMLWDTLMVQNTIEGRVGTANECRLAAHKEARHCDA